MPSKNAIIAALAAVGIIGAISLTAVTTTTTFTTMLTTTTAAREGSGNTTAASDSCSDSNASSSTTTAVDVSTVTNTTESWAKAYGKIAYDVGLKYGIPYEVILAQSAWESGWGGSLLSSQYHNYFGIKAWKDGQKTTNMVTNEEGASGTYSIVAGFVAYDSVEDGFNGYGEFITSNSRYSTALQYAANPQRYIEEMRAAGYATDSTYVSKIWGLTQQFISYFEQTGEYKPSSEVLKDFDREGMDTSGSSSSSSSTVMVGCTSTSNDGSSDVADSEKVETYVKWMINIANDDTHGYSMPRRTFNPDIDCSSFVFFALTKGAGFPSSLTWPFTTSTMGATLSGWGFKNVGMPETLKRGDILLNPSMHVEVYVGDGKNVGAHCDYDGVPGDSSGKEVNVDATLDFYTEVWRYTAD